MAAAPQRIDYLDGDLPLVGKLIRPEGPPRAAILVLPTIRGCDDVILRRAGLLADQGYMTLVADFYGLVFEDRSQMMAAGFALMDDAVAFRARLAAALDTLLHLSDLPVTRSAVVGHCMGGAGALELARAGHGLAAAVSFHGLLSTSLPARAGAVKARLLVCHGHLDTLVPPDQVRAFEAEMDAADVDWQLHVYAKARHGFTNPDAGAMGNPAVAFDASADRHSWTAMLTLLDEAFPGLDAAPLM